VRAHARAEELGQAGLAMLIELEHLKFGFFVDEARFFVVVATSYFDLAGLLLGFGGTLGATRLLLFVDLLVDLFFARGELLCKFSLGGDLTAGHPLTLQDLVDSPSLTGVELRHANEKLLELI